MRTPYPMNDHTAKVIAKMRQRKEEDRREARMLRDLRPVSRVANYQRS